MLIDINRQHKDYVSEADQFLLELDNSIASKSASRVLENERYKRIFDARDNLKITATSIDFWQEF